MNSIKIESFILNNTNIICSSPLLWSEEYIETRKSRLYVCIIALLIHSIFWFQLIFSSSLREKSLQWIYAYLIIDIFLLIRFFFSYIVHTESYDCQPNRTWMYFICYIEAIVDNYLNIVTVYILLVLNICRYIQIAYNRNVYEIYKNILILIHICIYLIPLVILVIQYFINWANLVEIYNDSCNVLYTSIYVQIFNIIIAFALPIILNVLMIYLSIHHVHLTATLRKTQHHVSARDKYHRSLVIQFLLFYIIWLSLWSPNVIVYQISNGKYDLTSIVRLLNFIEIALDPFIIAALDVRFWRQWKIFWMLIKRFILFNRQNQRQIRPLRGTVKAFTIRTPQTQANTLQT